MISIDQLIESFLKAYEKGHVKSILVPKKHIALFLNGLALKGVRIAEDCLHKLHPEDRKIVATLLYSTAAGAALGIAACAPLGPKAMAVGAAAGGGIGFVAAYLSLIGYFDEEGDGFRVTIS